MQKLKKKFSSQQQNSKMPPKKDNANNNKEAEKQAKEPTLNVLTKDSDVIRALQYIKFRHYGTIPRTRQKFLNFCHSNLKLKTLTSADMEKTWDALERLNLPQRHDERNFEVKKVAESAPLKSTGEQRVVNGHHQVEIEPNRKKPRLDLNFEKKINEKKSYSAPVSLMSNIDTSQWRYGSTQPRRANMMSSRKETPC